MKKMIAIALVLMLCVSALSISAFAAEGTEITIVPHESWGAVYVYTWGGVDMGGWPGTQINANADGKYVVTINGTIEGMVIGSGDGKPQTIDIKDLDLTKSAALITIGEAGSDGKHTYTVSYDGGNSNATPGNPEPPVVTPTFDAYYVAGTGALCNGKEWDPGAAENKMTKGDDGVYTITYTNVPAGDYEIKVTAGSWDNNWGANATPNGDNVKFSISEAGDITVKFNPNTGYINVYNGNNPLTGDMNLAGLSLALLAATAGLVALTGKKKEF